jgi:hypothetical protein
MLTREWFSAREIAELSLPGMPATESAVVRFIKARRWSEDKDRCRKRPGRGGCSEYHFSLLADKARLEVVRRFAKPVDVMAESSKSSISIQTYVRASAKKKDQAEGRLQALRDIEIEQAVVGRTKAIENVAASRGIAVSTVYNWIGRLAGVERQNAAAALVSANHGRTARVPCSDEAWQMLLALYLRLDKPPLTACFREVAAKGRELGWTIPSRSCLERRIQSDVPVPVRVLMREGREALAKLYPCQERDRSMFHALECVNADGHKWDDMVRWPDGYVGRPMMVAFQDLYSNLILSWRIDKSENKEAVRLAFGDMVETYGIPEHCWLDNGRSFASKWLTGGVQNRFRFKIKDEDPHGILPLLGTQVHWTKPFSGQSKPIERAFGEFAGNYAKHPRFAGAGTGNSPTNKPANYGDHVIPLDVFLEVVATCVAEHNSREGRKTRVCGGRLSFQQAFNASYATSIIRKATPEHRQLWLLAAEGVTARAKDGALHVMGNRYSAEELLAHRGTPMVVRFDPQMLLEDIHVYTLDGRFVCRAWRASMMRATRRKARAQRAPGSRARKCRRRL